MQRAAGKQDPTMRRTAQTLAVAGAIVGIGIAALPASAQAQGTAAVAGTAHAHRASPAPTAAQRKALARAKKLLAMRNQHGSIIGLVRGQNGAPEANVCVVASSPLANRKAYTGPDGRFTIAGLPRGAYRVEYRGCSPIARFTAQWYGGLTRNTAKAVLVTGAKPVQLPAIRLAMISPRFMPGATPERQLSPMLRTDKLIRKLAFGPQVQARASATTAGHLSGRVTSRDGHPLAMVCVFATSARHPGSGLLVRTSTSGGYRVKVRPGRYLVDFLPFCAQKGNFAPQLWKDAGGITRATAVRVKARQSVTHVDAALGTGAVITGRVKTFKNPHPSLGGLCVEASGTAGQRLFFGFTTTRSDGSFRLPSLATGKYKVAITPFCGHASPYLPTQLAKPVAVANGKVTSGITAFVKLGGTISGTVKDAKGNALAGICVDSFSESGSFAEATTAANGTYRLLGLRKGSYEVDFGPGCGNRRPFAPLTYPSQVIVHEGKVTPHIDAVMQLDGTLTGKVTNSSGQPLAKVCVVAQSSSFGFAFTQTRADGTYTAKRVPPGSYDVEFIPGGGFSGCGNQGNYLPEDLNASISSQVTTTLNATLATGGIIKGVVRDPHGKPLAGVCVFSTAEFGGQAITKSDGSYQLRQLFTGQYFVGYQGGCGNRGSVAPLAYKSDPTFFGPTTIHVTAGQVTDGINARLRPGGTITGRVTDQAGNPVGGVCVIAQAFTGGGGGLNGFGVFEIEHGGRFTANNLAPGQYGLLFFGLSKKHQECAKSPYADQQFFRQGDGAPLDLVTVPGGKITAGVDARLTLAGKISGVVLNRAGHPVSGICVTATDPRTGTSSLQFSGGRGGYTIGALPAGRYRVGFSSCGGDFAFFGITGLNYANQWYKGHASQSAADPVVVRASRTTTNINAALAKGATITGQVVYKPSHRPVSFVCVFAYTPDLSTLSMGLTDRRGHYLVDGLSTGRYILEFDPCSGESALAGQIRASEVHAVAGQAVHNVNAQMTLGGSVSGVTSMRLPGGRAKAAPGTCVEVLPLSPTASASETFSENGGSYLATNLAAGKYEILAGDPSCSSNSPALSARLSGPVQVAAGKTTAGANVGLKTAGAITGVVRGPGGKPISGICVEAVPQLGGIGIPAAITGAAGGTYRLGDLQPGTYKIKFTAGCGANGFATRWYKNARTEFGGRFVHVNAASVTSGINQTLPRS
jgi:hypothetical protein